ncbi:hypothetical protein Hypma_014513 [Hypsizygus marmoreus]|uniref:Uncharacterized protein n=1 Tax=Hypsizygus marmoreus TaxID=39966 RepID=A0A369JGE0_HYPMA|nr:hypothetical protein Hypma_014513 [Hypsizygus marmoreus]
MPSGLVDLLSNMREEWCHLCPPSISMGRTKDGSSAYGPSCANTNGNTIISRFPIVRLIFKVLLPAMTLEKTLWPHPAAGTDSSTLGTESTSFQDFTTDADIQLTAFALAGVTAPVIASVHTGFRAV